MPDPLCALPNACAEGSGWAAARAPFSSAGQLEQVLRRERTWISAFLEMAAPEEEWSLQGMVELAVCEEAMAAADPRLAKLPVSAGARYLMEQKLRKDAAQAARRWLEEAEAQVARALEGLVIARRSLRPPARSGQTPALEGAFRWALRVPLAEPSGLAAPTTAELLDYERVIRRTPSARTPPSS